MGRLGTCAIDSTRNLCKPQPAFVAGYGNLTVIVNVNVPLTAPHALHYLWRVWVLMVGCCCAEACMAAVLIGVMRLPGCPFGSAWSLVCEVCRLGQLG